MHRETQKALKGQLNQNKKKDCENLVFDIVLPEQFREYFDLACVLLLGIQYFVIYSPLCSNSKKVKIMLIGAEILNWEQNNITLESNLQHIRLQITAHWSIYSEKTVPRS